MYFFCLSSAYLANDGELRPVHVVAVDAEREDSSQRHHAAHRRHVVEVGLRVLDVAADPRKQQETTQRLFTRKLQANRNQPLDSPVASFIPFI